jgi:Uma2 family endonuclease
MHVEAPSMTSAQFLRLPPWPDGPRLELVEGEVVVHAPLPAHQAICTELQYALESWRREQPGRGRTWSPLDVEIDDLNVYNPDLMWYRAGRGPEPYERPSPFPDLAVEVRSPSTWRYDTSAKKSAYERRGLCELWLVDTVNEVVLVFRRSTAGAASFDVALEVGRGQALKSPLLPDFDLKVDALFDSVHG